MTIKVVMDDNSTNKKIQRMLKDKEIDALAKKIIKEIKSKENNKERKPFENLVSK